MFAKLKSLMQKLTGTKTQERDIKMPVGLSAQEQKQIREIIERARGDKSVPHSTQESIPFQRMFPDGICRVTDNYYTKTIQFQDINYQLAQQEDQTAIFEEWCSFLNFFDSSIRFELSFVNMATDASRFEKMIQIPFRKDNFNSVRAEYSTMLRRQLAQGNNGLTKTKYLTFGIEADSIQSGRTDVELGITREEFQEYLVWLNIHDPELFDSFLALQQLKAAEEQLYEKEKDQKN